MKHWRNTCALFLLCLLTAECYLTYDIFLSTYKASVGEEIIAQYIGDCSHSDLTGCYDFVAAYTFGACDEPGENGTNTCYMTGEWQWADHTNPNKKKRGDEDGIYRYTFLAPGTYDFRMSYCGCGGCQLILDEIISCNLYNTYGRSAAITITPPFPLDGITQAQQIVGGFMWYLMQQYGASLEQANFIVEAMLSRGGEKQKKSDVYGCIRDSQEIYLDLRNAWIAFDVLFEDFSMGAVQDCFRSVKNVLNATMPLMRDCGLTTAFGEDFSQKMEKMILRLVPGLGFAESVIEIIWQGEKVYVDINNFLFSMAVDNYFAAGIYLGKASQSFMKLI
eukprot:TRINITY_DN3781_c0_g3_i2.p1 TRINITY_DN3781_c0_g3~~TRINITY_DN3781_c0_g3_i2.p1  ORF type:complete len:334 (+),score=52.94 TRINITY_DN3781_c0_g3_i2:97-1098(+)